MGSVVSGQRRGVAVAVVVAIAAASLAACSSSSSSSAKATTTTIAVSAPVEGAIVNATTLPVRVTTKGGPSEVRAWVGDTVSALNSNGSAWTATLTAASGLVPGLNDVVFKASNSTGVLAKDDRHVYVLGAPADLGLSATVAPHDDVQALRIVLGRPAGEVRASVNGTDIDKTLHATPGTQTVDLGAGEHLHPGANPVTVTAVNDDGTFQQIELAISLPDAGAVASAGNDISARTGIPARLDATASKLPKGAPVSYRWDLLQVPAGSHSAIERPDSAQASITTDRAGTYVARVVVSQPGEPPTADTVKIISLDASIPPVGSHLQTQLAADNSIGVDGKTVVWNNGGTNVPATIAAGAQGAVLALFDRRTLDVLQVQTVDAAGFQTLVDDVNNQFGNADEGEIAVLSSPSGIGGSVHSPNTSWEPLLQALGVDDAKKQADWDKNVQYGRPFSFVSVIRNNNGKPAPEAWRSSNTPSPTTSAPGASPGTLPTNISGYLELSTAGAGPFVFIPDTHVPIQTSSASSPTTNTMQLGPCDPNPPPNSSCAPPIVSPPIATCAAQAGTGGFQVVVFWASSLEVVENKSFATNSGCGTDGLGGDGDALAAMASLLGKYPDNGGTDDHLIAIQSIGTPRPPSSTLDGAWLKAAGAVESAGGVGSPFASLGWHSGYTLLGADDLTRPGSDLPFGLTANGDAPNMKGAASISAILTRNHRNDLAPGANSIGGPIGNGIGGLVYASPTPWPVPCAPGTCAAGTSADGESSALDYIRDVTAPNYDPALAISNANDGLCYDPIHPSFRASYCNTAFSQGQWLTWGHFLCKPGSGSECTPLSPPPRNLHQPGTKARYSFTGGDWNAVVTQLSAEAVDMSLAVAYLAKLTKPATWLATGAAAANDDVQKDLVTPMLNKLGMSATGKNDLKDGLSFGLAAIAGIAGVVWAILGTGGAAIVAAGVSEVAALASTGVDQFCCGAGPGMSGKVQTAAQDVLADMNRLYSNVPMQIGWMGEIIYSDWGKLDSFAKGSGGDAADASTAYEATKTSALRWAYPQILTAAFEPNELRQWLPAAFPPHQVYPCTDYPGYCAQLMQNYAPYGGDALNFSCNDADALYPHYLPFQSTRAEAQYLALPPGGSPTRYVLANVPPDESAKNLAPTPGNPTDFFVPEDDQIPPTPPNGVLSQMFTPLPAGSISLPTKLADLHLGLFKPDVYEHTFTLSSGSTVTCRNHLGPYRGLAAMSNGASNSNVFYFTQDAPPTRVPSTLTNIYSIGGYWNGPGPMPGTPDTDAGLAAVLNNVFFVQNGHVVVDTYANNGWQKPVQLPADPKKGTPLAATYNGPNDIHVFFDSTNGFTNDWWDGTKWNGPGPLPGRPDDGSGIAAVEDVPGQSFHVFFVHDGLLFFDQWTTQHGWQGPAPLQGAPDAGTPLAATSTVPNDMHVFFAHGGLLNNVWYSPQSGWQGPAGLPTTPDPGTGLAATVVGPGDANVYAMSGGALVFDYYSSEGWQEAPVLYPR